MNNQNSHEIQEDEIDLRELGRTLIRHKLKIFLFTIFTAVCSIIFVLSKPNIYESQAVLVPQEQPKGGIGGLSALAGIAGIDLGGGSMTPEAAYNALLQNDIFLKEMIIRYNLLARFDDDSRYVFAMNNSNIYHFFKKEQGAKIAMPNDTEKKIFGLIKTLSSTITVVSDKKTSLLTVSAKHADSVLAKDLVEIFLKEASSYLIKVDMMNNDKQIAYYTEELQKSADVTLKNQLSTLISGLVQKKVLAKAGEYYNVKVILRPSIAFILDKKEPKRALIVVVSSITGLILSIFGVFFWEFLGRKEPESV